jgi:hypothetical protein
MHPAVSQVVPSTFRDEIRALVYRSLVVIDAALVVVCVVRRVAPMWVGDEWHLINQTGILAVGFNGIAGAWKAFGRNWLGKSGVNADHFAESVFALIPLPSSRVAAALSIAAFALLGVYMWLTPVSIVVEPAGGETALCGGQNELVAFPGVTGARQSPIRDPKFLDGKCQHAFSQTKQHVVIHPGVWVPAGRYTLTLSAGSGATFEYVLVSPPGAELIRNLVDKPSPPSIDIPLREPDDRLDPEQRNAPGQVIVWFTMQHAQQQASTAVRVTATLKSGSSDLASSHAKIIIPYSRDDSGVVSERDPRCAEPDPDSRNRQTRRSNNGGLASACRCDAWQCAGGRLRRDPAVS